MSLAYIDPGNLEAEVQLGAYTGARLIWVLWWSTVVGAMLQELAARIGMVSGNDLAHAVRARYPRWLTYTVYVNLELAIMGADLQDLLGTAHALRLLTGLPLYLGAIVSSALSMLLLYVYESQRRYMEVGIGITILIVCTCFFVNMWHAQPKVGDIVEGMVVPGMQWWAALPALGCVGAVIMPHNLFLHSNVRYLVITPSPCHTTSSSTPTSASRSNPHPHPHPHPGPRPHPGPHPHPHPSPPPTRWSSRAVASRAAMQSPAACSCASPSTTHASRRAPPFSSPTPATSPSSPCSHPSSPTPT